jgi:hypothetical protein
LIMEKAVEKKVYLLVCMFDIPIPGFCLAVLQVLRLGLVFC